jgi:aminoglycoside N3'-acetyltransferase
MSSPLYVHTDLSRYLAAFPQFVAGASSADEMSQRAYDAMFADLTEISEDTLIVPSYNYSFTKTGRFDMRTDRSEVGHFSELFRQSYLDTRSSTPVFSNCANRAGFLSQDIGPVIDPFREDGDFGRLTKANGRIASFGAPFAPTYIMYIERQVAGGPLYRYDKIFTGSVIDLNGAAHDVTMLYHVRPLSVKLVYDLPKIEAELAAQGILEHRALRDVFFYTLYNARGFLEYALDRIAKEPMYFLTEDCQKRLTDADVFKNGRVKQSDFEG